MKRIVFIAFVASLGALLMAAPATTSQKPASNKTAKTATMRNAWSPENISGKILAIDKDGRLLVVEGPDKVPFDIVVTRSTRVRSQSQNVALSNLSQYLNRSATIRMVPERRGDVARSIQIGS
jgi:hypothetical protein